MSEAVNPYAAPAARVEDTDTEAEAIRRAHINHEASIKAVGVLYYLGGALVGVSAAMVVIGAQGDMGSIWFLVFLLAIAFGQLAAGYGVRALLPWGRIVGGILSALGLIAFPIGTIINAYILYLFLSKKGRTIFSPGYRDVIAATPHVKYKTSIIVWIFLALILGLMVFGLIAAYK